MDRLSALARIRDISAELGPNGLQVLVDIAERLAVGARQYGDFETQREWCAETIAEHLDSMVYLTQALRAIQPKAGP